MRAPVGETNRADRPLAIGRGIAAIRFRDIEPEFGWHALNHAKRAFDRLAQGSTFEAIGAEVIRALELLLPPIEEQRAIAAVLDAVDDTIDRTEAVIAATEDLRRGLLHELLTRGVPGMHSEWRDVPGLGTVPACWNVTTLGELARSITSGSRGWSRFYRSSGALFVRSQNIVDGGIDQSDAIFVDPPQDGEAKRTRIRSRDLLITITGEPGKAAVAPNELGEAYVSQHVGLVRLTEDGLADFVGQFLRGEAGRGQLDRMAYGQTRPGLNLTNLEQVLVAVPADAERGAVVQASDSISSHLSDLVRSTCRLRELKAALSDALLTGCIRTRATIDA